MVQRNVLILSPHFPPSTVAGVHRARHLAKHLPAAGWTPIVLCVDERYHTERLDPDLARLVPEATEIVKVGVIGAGLSRRLGVGDISLRGYLRLRQALLSLLRTRQIDVVLITGSPYYTMLMTRAVRRMSNVPVVLDFQDPWVSNWGATLPAVSKGGLAHRLSVLLEPFAVRHANYITSVSDVQNQEMASRYAGLNPANMAAIPIGSDPDDYTALGRRGGEAADATDDDGAQIVLSFVGTVMPRTAPVLRALFAGLRKVRIDMPELAAKFRLRFVGTSNQPADVQDGRVLFLARELGVGDLVSEHPARVPYLQALSTLQHSSAILLLGSDEPHYTASKIYPALMSGRPFISVFRKESSAHAILSGCGGGLSYAFSDAAELNALPPQIADGLVKFAENPTAVGTPDPQAYAPYEARSIARRFADIFDTLVGGKAGVG
ncbi:MAG: glycosyltransferase [Pseudomonadota bacterium]